MCWSTGEEGAPLSNRRDYEATTAGFWPVDSGSRVCHDTSARRRTTVDPKRCCGAGYQESSSGAGCQLNYQASRQAVTEARSAYYPAIGGDVTGSQGNPQARIGAGDLSAPRLFDRFAQGISVSQLITDSGRTSNLVASSKLQAQASSQTYQAPRYDVLWRVNQAYFDALRAQGLVKVAQETVAARQLLVDQVTTLAQNKLRSQLDVSFAAVSLAQAKLLLIRTQDTVQQALAELTEALGIEQQQAYTLVDEPLPASPPADSATLVAQAMQERPELAGLRLERDARYHCRRAEKSLSS